jgi:hypothetical protein
MCGGSLTSAPSVLTKAQTPDLKVCGQRGSIGPRFNEHQPLRTLGVLMHRMR